MRYLLCIISLSLLTLSLFNSCKKNNTAHGNLPAPLITSIYPQIVAPGGSVVITGENFTSEKNEVKVSIKGTEASVIYADSNEIVIQIPQNTASGQLTMMINRIVVTGSAQITINEAAPVVTAFNPAVAAIGETITVTGRNFRDNFSVTIGNKAVEVKNPGDGSFSITIPENLSDGRVEVRSGGMSAVSPHKFRTPARIQSVSSKTGREGDTLTISGENFATHKKDIKIFFGENPATDKDIVSLSSTTIEVKAPQAGTNGALRVEQFGTVSNSKEFFYLPTISSFEPEAAEPGEIITIHDHRFAEGNTVNIEGRTAQIVEITPTTVKIKVPERTAGGTLEVRSGGRAVEASKPLRIYNTWLNVEVTNPSSQQGAPFVIGDRIYFLNTSNIGVFNFTTKTWMESIDLPNDFRGRSSHIAIVKDNKTYLGTGSYYETGAMLKDWWQFDPSQSNPWRRMTDFPEISSFGAGFTIDNKMYVGLGQTSDLQQPKKLYQFNLEGNGSWGEAIVIPEIEHIPNMSFTINSVAYFGSGQNLYKLQPENAVPVTRVASFPVDNYSGYVSQHRSLGLGNKGYLYFSSKFYEFDPVNASWSELNAVYLSYTSRMAVVNNHLIAFDGSAVWEYIPRP